MIQALLTHGKGLTDLSIYKSGDGKELHFNLGLALMEVVPNESGQLQYRMALGRLVNGKWPLADLTRLFTHDHKTLARWGDALKSGDPGRFSQLFAGRGQGTKVSAELELFAKGRYLALRGQVRDFRKRVAEEVSQCFGVKLSGECLRRLFREADGAAAHQEAAEPGHPEPVPAASPAASPDGPPQPLRPRALLALPPAPRVRALLPPAPMVAILEETAAGALPRGASSCATPSNSSSFSPSTRNSAPVSAPPGPTATDSAQAKAEAPGGAPKGTPIPLPAPPSPLPGFVFPSRPSTIHHAGHALFLPWLERGLGADEAAWVAQVLQGALNIEQSKRLCPDSLELLLGRRPGSIPAQRAALAALAAEELLPDRLAAANAELLADGPGGGDCFYYDPHTKEYSGGLPFLKGWCGRIHGVAKCLHLDFIHTESGSPCFVRHYDNYYDLRERLPMTLARFDLLFPEGRRQGRTFILDRGVFGEEPFAMFESGGDYLVTWEKGYAGGGWDAAAPSSQFTIVRPRNRSDDLRVWRFELQESPWKRRAGWRRFVVRASNPRGNTVEVAVLCSHPDMAAGKAVKLIFSRWLQENDFKTLDRHFGLMEMTGRSSEGYAAAAASLEDRQVESGERKAARKALCKAEGALGKALLAKEMADASKARAALEAASLAAKLASLSADGGGDDRAWRLRTAGELAAARNTMSRLAKRVAKLDALAAAAALAVAEARPRFEASPATESRLERAVREGRRRPDTRKKAVMDNLKIMSRNIFHCLLAVFRRHYDNRRDDVAVLRTLTRSPGVVRMSGGEAVVELWPKANLPKATRRRVRAFLADVEERVNRHYQGRAAPVRLRLLDAPPKL